MTKQRIRGRTTATLTAAGFLLLSAGPAMAAEPVAQAEAEAIRLSIGPESVSSQVAGPYSVTTDGRNQTSTGNNAPQASLLAGQDAASIGTLAQDATTSVGPGGRGSSAACAGVAGDGATLVETGESGEFCLTPGDTAQLTAGQIDLSELSEVDLVTPPGGAADLPSSLQDLLLDLPGAGPQLADAIDTLNDELQVALEPFGNAGLVLDLGAIQSQCTAGPGTVAAGSARLTDVGAFLQFDGTGAPVDRIALLEFTPDPAPNTPVATGIDEVIDLVVGELVSSLEASDVGLPDEAIAGLNQIREAVRDNLTDALADELDPLEENLLSGTLNKQTRSPGAIEVTAVDLQVLPALAEPAGFSLVDTQLGRSSCGPGGQEAAPPAPEPSSPPVADPPAPSPGQPAVPTSVPAGLADDSPGVPPELALAALTILATATGVAVHRRGSRV